MSTTSWATLDGQLAAALQDFRRLYVQTKTFPDNTTYADQYAAVLARLDQVQVYVRQLHDDTEQELANVTSRNASRNAAVQSDKRVYDASRDRHRSLQARDRATAVQLYDDQESVYDVRYARNIGLGATLLACTYTAIAQARSSVPSPVKLPS